MPATLNGRSCGTCEYWSGNRILYQNGRAVQCSSSGDRGYCRHKTMSHTIAHPAIKPGCPKYVKWSSIR